MSLLDGYEEQLLNQNTSKNVDKPIQTGSLLEGYQAPVSQQKTFAEAHPFAASIPEAGKQFGLRALKSYPEFAKGLNDAIALAGDKFNNQALSNFGRSNVDYWNNVANNIKTDEKYQGLKGLSKKETFLPTLAGEVGGQATNLLMALGGGAGGAGIAAKAGLSGLGKAGLITAGSSVPNVAQEGQYLDKIETFKNIYGRLPNEAELKKIQNVALGEKGVNTALETVADRLLFAKLFPQGTVNKGIKNILKSAGEQAVTEAGTEGLQEASSIGAESILGINQGNNLERLAEAATIGGLTGGVIGGVSTAASQPYNANFQQAPVQDGTNATTSVSAKLIANGKELYNNAIEKVANIDNNTAFDALRATRQPIDYSKIAPNIAKKVQVNNALSDNDAKRFASEQAETQPNLLPEQPVQEIAQPIQQPDQVIEQPIPQIEQLSEQIQDTGLPNLVEEGNLYNIPEEQEIVAQAQAQEIANELARMANNEQESTAVLEAPQQLETPQEIAPVVSEIEQIAPNIAEKKKSKELTEVQPTEALQGRVEVTENLNEQPLETVQPKKETLSTIKSDIKANKFDKKNLEVYKGTKQGKFFTKSLDSLENDSIKSEREFNNIIDEISNNTDKLNDSNYLKDLETRVQNLLDSRTPYGDVEEVSTQYWEKFWNAYNKGIEYNQLKESKAKKPTEIEKIAPNIAKKVSKNKQSIQPIEVVEDKISIQQVAPEISKKNELLAKAKDLGIRGNLKSMKLETLQKKINEAESKVDNNKMIYEGWKVQDFIDELEPLVNQIYSNNSIQKPFKNREELKKWTMDNQPYYKKYIPDVVNYFAQKHNIPNEIAKQPEKNKKKDEVTNGESITNVDGNRPTVSQKQEKAANKREVVSQEQSEDVRSTNEVRRGDNISDEQLRGRIEKQYKNQNELNKDIENFINNKKYEQYGDNLPEELKNWLKKYTGAGGLEKQGAEGKGLLSEYYTPKNIVDKMWDLTAQYIDVKGAKVLEPSVGIGRFLENAPEGLNFDVVEMNPVSAKITELLYPNANVEVGEFQKRFIDEKTSTPKKKVDTEYDIIIGNPPYGAYSGRYKGLGEGKGINRIETYFIRRGLDVLNENGIMTFIVPSSFLDGAITKAKQEIGIKAELLDAYRLPENTFDTTSIGTDIIVLRKTKLSKNTGMFNLGNWFKKHPEKILGTTETRTNRFGKEETFVKGDKNAVENIDTSKKDIRATEKISTTQTKTETKPVVRKARTTSKADTTAEVKKGNVEYTSYVPEKTVSDEDMKYYRDTLVDGSLPSNKYMPNDKVSMYKGKLYNDFNYLQGDIYEKLDALEKENISDAQKEIQRKKLNKVLPKPKTVNEISFNPTSDFIRELEVGQMEIEEYDYYNRRSNKKIINATLDRRYKKYVQGLTSSERNDIPVWDINKFIDGDEIRIDYKYTYSMTDAEKKSARNAQRAEYIAKLKNTVDKTFNDFVQNELSAEDKKTLEKAWNRNFNNTYNPDFKDIPLLIKDLNSVFYGNPLKLQDVQVEGINFLTNKGVGLLGFEVGVGKTLSGIVSTVQNMQMGRTKRPLVLVPNQVKDNWIAEFKETFPNMPINDVGNLSRFNGEIKDGTVTVATYEAMDNIWYDEGTISALISKTYDISGKTEKTERGREKAKERIEQFVAQAEKGNKKKFTIQELGFDHITVDEAHNFRNLFAEVKADNQKGNTYNITGGATSNRAVRLFLLSQYILDNNGNRNVFMLTATPFNNSLLEVFNMLSFISKDKLDRMGLYNVHQFMENYADITADWIVNSKNEVEYKQIVKGFKNAGSLREIIKDSMLIRSAEDAGIVRPNKIVNRVVLEPSKSQLELIAQAEAEATTGKKDEGAVLKAINKSRKATLSPDIATNNIEISPEEFIKNSPKLEYTMNAIESMVKKDPETSQILYMPLGVDFLPKIKQYLVNKGVFKANEIEIIKSGVSDDKLVEITSSFNDPKGKVKLIIGTNKIKEGMNLNKNSSVLYIPYLDWNPTDFVQVVGRIWRRGNKYKDIRVVVPLLKNSSDSFMFQKLDEKTSRINNIMDESREYIDTGELNTAEEKVNMISIPEKKVLMYKKVEEQKLNNKKLSLEGHLETVQYYKHELNSLKKSINSVEEDISENEAKLSGLSELENKWSYNYTKDNIEKYKKDLASKKSRLRSLETKIKRLEIDFEGKDSEENIKAQIEDIEKQKADLEERSKAKLAEYQDEYEKERKNTKTIKQLIKDFETETDRLYGTVSTSKPNKVDESIAIDVEPRKRYEKTGETQYSVPVINLETQSQKKKKSRKKETMEKAKQVVDAKKYNKILKKGVEKWATEINVRRYNADRIINAFIRQTKNIAKELNVNEVHLREIMPFLRERTDFPSELNRPELKAVWDKVQNKKYDKMLTDLADKTSDSMKVFWDEYQAVQAGGEYKSNDIENYIPHEWDLGDKKQEAILNNFIMTKSKYAKQRKIESLYKGIQGIELENGEVLKLTPKVLDYAKLLKMQSDSLIKATVDKTLADSVKSFKTEEGASLVLPASQAPNNWVIINNDALNKTVARPVKTSYGEKISPELQNKLSDIGIAIGRRLSKYKPSGMPNSLGRYIENEPPEIRLQKWFSLKTLAHEVGHAMDSNLNLSKDGFVNRHRDELMELNKERIEALEKQGKKEYATSDRELTAELFGVMFNDIEMALKYAPSATSEVLERMSANDKLAQLLPANFDWQDAKHVIEEKVVEFFKVPVKVHPDIAATLKTVFEEKTDYIDFVGFKPGKILDEANAVAKMFNFSLSGFHMWALSESYLGNVGATKGIKEVLNFKKIYNSLKNGDYDIYKKDDIARQAIKDGLQIGATLDVQRGAVEETLDNVGKYLEKNIPAIGKPFSMPVRGVAKAAELNNKILWDVIHNNYKLGAYELLVNNEKNITPEKRREIAQWVNDSFGGLIWEVLGIGKKGKRTLSRVLMSPDWLLATTRQFMGMFSTESGHKKLNELASKSKFWQKAKETTQFLGINSLTDDIEASGTRGRIARAFWLRAFIQSAIYMNVLNALFRLWDREKNPQLYPKEMTAYDYSMLGNARNSRSTVFIGRNKDGTERYVRFGKQFREVPELLEDPFKKLGGKGSPMLQTASTLFTGKTLSGFENREYSKAEGWGKVGLAARELAEMYMPFSLSSAINKGTDYSLFDLVATTGKGMTKFKGGKEFEKIYSSNNDINAIKDVRRSMMMSGFKKDTIDSVEKRAKSMAYSQYKKDYMKALGSGNPQNVQNVTKKLDRKNVNKLEQRKIYSRALKDYMDSKR